MIKKKFLIPLFFTGLLAMNTAFAASEKVIPYPAGLDTTTEGASSAPKEINHPDSKYFKENDFYEMTPSETLILLKNYPTYQQTTEYTCGPAAGLTVLNFYGNKNFDEMTLKNGMKTQGYPIGTNAADMAKFFEGIGWYVDSSLKHEPFETYEAFGEWIVDTLEQNTPILVENVDWGGHWRVIIGYDTLGTESPLDDVLILMDSYDTCDHNQNGYVVVNGEKFYSMWFNHSMLPEKQRNQPWVITRPKTVVEENKKEISSIFAKSEVGKKTDQIILVADHNLSFWNKKDDKWDVDLQSYCGYGKKGFSRDRHEGDMTTPVGSFPILFAFGFSENPGTEMTYKQITENTYFSGKGEKYNQWIDYEIRADKSSSLRNTYQFKYGMNTGFNFNPVVPGKGSGIFLHCRSWDRWWSHGCVTVPEKIMLDLIKKSHDGEYIVIVPKLDDLKSVVN